MTQLRHAGHRNLTQPRHQPRRRPDDRFAGAYRVIELDGDDLVLLALLRKGAMTRAQLHALGPSFAVNARLRRLARHGLVETRLELYLINDGGLRALANAVTAASRALTGAEANDPAADGRERGASPGS
jgi:hypothetical protein